MKKAYLLNIKGRVTGVGFRYSAIAKAGKIPDISGYVRNLGYGEVEVLIQGEEKGLTEMRAWLQKGPPLARVDSLSLVEAPYDITIKRFEIR